MTPLQRYIYSVRTILKTTEDRICICDPDGNFICANSSFLEFIKIDDKKIKKINFEKLTGKDTWNELNEKMNRSEPLQTTLSFPTVKKRNITAFIFDLHYFSTHVARVFILPIISKSESLQIINLKEDNFVKVLNGRANSAWFIADIHRGKYHLISNSYKVVFGYEPASFYIGGGPFFFSLLHPDDIQGLLDHYGEWLLLKNKLGTLYQNKSFRHTFRFRAPDGTYRTAETEANLLQKNADDETLLLMGSYQLIPDSQHLYAGSNNFSGKVRFIDGKSYIDIDHVRDLSIRKAEVSLGEKFKVLSGREFEILQLIIAGCSSEEISVKLFISIHTVNMHRKQLMKKLNAKNLAELIRIYYTT